MKNSNVKSTFLLLLSALCSFSCKTNVQPEKPTKEQQTLSYNPELSTLNIPLEISLVQLQNKVNQHTSEVLYHDNSFTNNGNDGVKIKVIKNGMIKLNASSNTLFYQVPLSVELIARQVVLGFELIQSTSFEIEFDFKSEIDMDRKWNLLTKTTAADYRIITEPKINFGPVTMTLEPIVDFVIGKTKHLMAQELDEQLKKNFDAKSYVQAVWKEVQKPIHLSEEYHAWLLIKPHKLSMTTLTTNRRRLILNVSVQAYTEVMVSKALPHIEINNHLPDLIKVTSLSPNFFISLGSVVSYYDANEILKKTLLGYVYEQGNKHIEITDIRTSSNGDKLVLEIHFTGSFRGVMYMTGIPSYNEKTNTLFVDNFDFDIKTKQALLKVGSWLLHGTFKKKMIEYSTISITEQIEEARLMVEESLNSNELMHGVKLECRINQIAPKGIYLNKEGIQTILHIEGETKVKL